MIAAAIAEALGNAHREGRGWRCRCLVHGGHSLLISNGRDGRLLVKCWVGCDPRDILAELRRRGLIDGDAGAVEFRPDPAETERRRKAGALDRARRIALAHDMIAELLPAGGTVVERYLQGRIPGITEVPRAIRYLPMSNPYAWHARSGGRRPVMVVAVEHAQHGLVGTHRTWLAIDGSTKATLDPVRMCTGPVGGGAVRLAPAADTLMVGEGIETCLAAMTATAMPVWAALSAGGIEKLILPTIIRTVIVLADNDTRGVGEHAARTAAQRWLAEGRRVRIAMPPDPGTDFADVLLGAYVRSVEVSDVAA